ncbi:50S ribosomal protein L32 [Mycoplasmopsis agassizii]|uniref:Large ribosomal subunit protein bL32 n=1 Tax=Mycoplasmopsis agassizii TaxID=33922 RepID=A0A269TK70_9BACT|nr:50S ribosomal protein L32 [Mycoplasmopsis agassizii]PAK21757.1 50S ribosomal protein L32 [Mycoplasmopsis agassizii]
MAIVPKRKTSKQRRNKRRTHDSLTAVTTTTCSHCSKQTIPHHACTSCGWYKGRQVVDVKNN